MPKWKTYLLVSGVSLGALLAALLWVAFGPAAPLEISTATTRLTEPLTKSWQVDYAAVIRLRCGLPVPPERNKAVPLLLATWPCGLTAEQAVLLAAELQIEPPPHPPGLRLDAEALRTALNPTPAGSRAPIDPFIAIDAAQQSPWRREQFAPLADLLDAQTQQIDLLHEIAERPAFYAPSTVFLDQEVAPWFDEIEPAALAAPTAAQFLKMRAMLRIGEQDLAAAWQDIRAIYAISEAIPPTGSLRELARSADVRQIAIDATWALLSDDRCDAPLLDEIDSFLVQIPVITGFVDAIDQRERYIALDIGQRICHGDASGAREVYEGSPPVQVEYFLSAPFDRNQLMRTLNQRYDRIVAAMRLPDPLDAYQANYASDFDPWLAQLAVDQRLRGELLASLICSSYTRFPHFVALEQECQTALQLLQVGVALARYRRQQGHYPAQLTEIANDANRLLLTDPYGAEPLRYERTDDGFLLYSRFLNGVDDGGLQSDGSIIGGRYQDRSQRRFAYEAADDCDLAVLIPRPPFRLQQSGEADADE